MRKYILYSLLLFVALNAFGHTGEVHSYMGTVTKLDDDGSFLLTKTDGKNVRVHVSKETRYVHADGRVAGRAELVTGRRVVVTLSKDGRTATSIKLAAVKPAVRKP